MSVSKPKPIKSDWVSRSMDNVNKTEFVEFSVGDSPYLWVGFNSGPAICIVEKKRKLRALAHRILRAIGDE